MSDKKRKEIFKQAVEDLGHEISFMENQRISIETFSDSYGVPMELIVEAIENKRLQVHYDYEKEVVWLDVLEACYFSYCLEVDRQSVN